MSASDNWLSWTSKTLMIAMGLFMLAPATWAASPLVGQEQAIVQATNAIRRDQGLSPLVADARLMVSAQNKARDMAVNGYFSHESQAGHRMAYWIRGAGYDYALVGENLAKGFSAIDRLMVAWTNSPLHYKNLVEPRFVNIGVGIAEGILDGLPATFVVQHFGEPTVIATAVSTGGAPSVTSGLIISDRSQVRTGLRVVDQAGEDPPIAIAAVAAQGTSTAVIDYWMSWVMLGLIVIEVVVLVVMSFRSWRFVDEL